MEQAFGEALKEGEYINFRDDGNEIYTYISYDGGNHPEYASNLVSECYGVGKKNDKVYFNVEDCEEYDIDRVTDIDLDALVDAIIDIKKFF